MRGVEPRATRICRGLESVLCYRYTTPEDLWVVFIEAPLLISLL